MERSLAAILAADVLGYSHLMAGPALAKRCAAAFEPGAAGARK